MIQHISHKHEESSFFSPSDLLSDGRWNKKGILLVCVSISYTKSIFFCNQQASYPIFVKALFYEMLRGRPHIK